MSVEVIGETGHSYWTDGKRIEITDEKTGRIRKVFVFKNGVSKTSFQELIDSWEEYIKEQGLEYEGVAILPEDFPQ